MKNLFVLIFFMMVVGLLTPSCGKLKHEVNGEAKAEIEAPERISLEPDFQKAAIFCDQRYLPDEIAAESCFKDFRTYYKPTVGIDLTNVVDYCKGRYEEPEEQKECENDLLDLINDQQLEQQ